MVVVNFEKKFLAEVRRRNGISLFSNFLRH
jgi:hypothetical protein